MLELLTLMSLSWLSHGANIPRDHFSLALTLQGIVSGAEATASPDKGHHRPHVSLTVFPDAVTLEDSSADPAATSAPASTTLGAY